jgi:predicted amidophosphoribosyltransferase
MIAPQQQRFFCDNCEREVFLSAKYCDNCGGEIKWPENVQMIQTAWNKSEGNKEAESPPTISPAN